MIWHSSDKEQVLSELSVDENKGLANGVAEMRLEEYGKNLVSSSKKESFGEILVNQLKNKLTISLFVILSITIYVKVKNNRIATNTIIFLINVLFFIGITYFKYFSIIWLYRKYSI